MTYKEAITRECYLYSKHPKSVFIGYNTVKGSRMYGTLNKVPKSKCIEAPVAENLMMGLAMGMSLEGYRPVVCYERHDFLLLALDALINHVDKMPYLSGYQYKFPIIIRAIVGSSHPLDPGPQHTGNYGKELLGMLRHTPVMFPSSCDQLVEAWEEVGRSESGAVVIVEERDIYEQTIVGPYSRPRSSATWDRTALRRNQKSRRTNSSEGRVCTRRK